VNHYKKILFFIILCSAWFFYSCNPTKNIADGQYLVNRNKVSVDNSDISTDDLSSYIKQKPNRRILGVFRFHLGVYNSSVLWKKARANIGEPPVILDTLLTQKSIKQIKLYLNSKGFFNSEVQTKINYKRKKANIKYIVHTSKPYCIRNIAYNIEDEYIRSQVVADTMNSLLKRGGRYDVDVLQSERERLTVKIKNDGYFFFTKEYILYDIDSALNNHQLDITMGIRNPVEKLKNHSDSVVPSIHKRYTINNINIYPDYSLFNVDTANYKRLRYWALPRKKTAAPSLYTFVYKDTLRIKPKTITQSVFFKKGNEYKLTDVEDTYNRLMDIKLFKFVNIQFFISKDTLSKDTNLLDCDILLTRTPIQAISGEVESTNTAGNFGVAGNILYQNKNIFRGAEIFKIKFRGAMEIQKLLSDSVDETGLEQVLPFNTVETGIDFGLDIPKFFLIPVKQERFSKYFIPKTNVVAGLNYQKRSDYTRYVINFTYGYEYKPSKNQKIFFYPADVNSVKITTSPAFDSQLEAINDPKIKNSYIDHMITAGKFSYIFSNQKMEKNTSFSYFKGNAEWAGNLLRVKNLWFKNYQNADGSYELFNIKYSQYARADIDYRHYFIFDKINTLVFHGIAGAGIAYGNSIVLPYEKSFFAGGANGMRAWRVYSLGPGSYSDEETNLLSRTGDISLLGNVEYRFPVYSYLKGAFFVDAGNIWLNKKNDNMPEAEFTSSFYKQVAVGTGFGMRFDFSFFILRFDFALKAVNPANPEGQRWVLHYIKPKDFAINFGIGYPF